MCQNLEKMSRDCHMVKKMTCIKLIVSEDRRSIDGAKQEKLITYTHEIRDNRTRG